MPTWVLSLVRVVVASVSGPLREAIVKSMKEWEAKARETKSPWDDILVGCVKWLLNVQ